MQTLKRTFDSFVTKRNRLFFINFGILYISSEQESRQYFEESEVSKLKDALVSCRQMQSYLGLIDNLDWVLSMTLDPVNNFDTATEFVEYLVVDNIYTDNFLATTSTQPGSPYRAMIGREDL